MDFYGLEEEVEEESEEDILLHDDVPMMLSLSPEDIDNGVVSFDFISILDYNDATIVSASTNSSSAINNVRTGTMNYVDMPDSAVTYTDTIYIASDSIICESGKIFNLSLSNITSWWDYKRTTSSSSSTVDCYCVDTSNIDITVYFTFADGSRSAADFEEIIFSSTDDKYFYFSASLKEPLSHDLYGIDIEFKYDVTEAYGMPLAAALVRDTNTVSYYPHHTIGFYNSVFTFREVEQTNGLLGTIIEWLRGISNSISDLPGNIISGISDILKDLFVPEKGYVNSMRVRMNTLLTERFGALYESFDFVLYFFESFNLSDSSDIVVFPEISIPMPEGNEFVFGGWEVDVVPDVISDVLSPFRIFVNVILSLAFGNMVFRKFEFLIKGA